MGVLFSGIAHVAGEQDTGKSTFAFECGAMPEDMAFIDDDIKGIDKVEQIREQGHEIGFYRNLVSLGVGLKEIEFHNACLNVISEMEAVVKERGKKFEVVIWDTWTRFETTFHPYIVAFPTKFRSSWSPNGVIKGAEQWKESFRLENEVINRLQGVGKLVILTTHLKPETVAGRKTGKFIPDCKSPLIQKSILRVYLRHNPDGPAPIGLILKRISKTTITENGVGTISILPRKMKPFTWAEIRKYWDNPIGDRPLTESEKPDEYELSILDGTLTADQKEILRMQEAPMGDDELAGYPEDVVEKVKELKASGKPNPVIARECAISVSDVVKITSE